MLFVYRTKVPRVKISNDVCIKDDTRTAGAADGETVNYTSQHARRRTAQRTVLSITSVRAALSESPLSLVETAPVRGWRMFIEGRNKDCFGQQHEPEPDAYSTSACSEFAGDKTKFNHSESKAIKGEEPLANTSCLRYNYPVITGKQV